MHPSIEQFYNTITGTHTLRDQLLDMLTDAELRFTPGGSNPTLGALFRDMGEVEHSYTESLVTLKQDWTYRSGAAEVETSVARLRAWLKSLDAQLTQTVDGLSEADLDKVVDRGFESSIRMQLDIYLQALLIFLGKATVYCRALNKPLPRQVQDWIG